MVRESTARTPSRTVDRRRRRDPCRHGAEAEDGLARCPTYSGLAAHEPFSAHLGAVAGGAGSAANVTPSAQAGSLSYFGNEPTARVGHGARPLPEETGRLGPRSTDRADRAAAAAHSVADSPKDRGPSLPVPSGRPWPTALAF